MDYEVAGTPAQRKVWQDKKTSREQSLRPEDCCHDALPFCRHSAHTRTSRYVSDNVKESICSARIFTVRRHLKRMSQFGRDSFSGHGGKTSTGKHSTGVVRKVKGCYSSPFNH